MSAPPLPELRTPALVLTDGDPAAVGPVESGVSVARVGPPPPRPPEPRGWASVTLVAEDETALRRWVSTLPPLGRCRSVAVVLRSAVAPVVLVPRPEWPALRDLDAHLGPDGTATTTVELASGAPATAVLVELARGCGSPAVSGGGGLVGAGAIGSPADPLPVSDTVPPTVVPAGADAPSTDITAQPPVAVPAELGAPLDEALLGPQGFRREWTRPVVDLDPAWRPTAALVASLRDAAAVRVPADAPPRLVAGLAMAGVPLLQPGSTVDPADLDDPVAREEHSITTRRAAFDEHSTHAWRARVASVAAVRAAAYPSVTVVLTAPPDRLDHARAQLDRQRGVRVVDPDDGPADTVLLVEGDGWWGPEVVLDLLRARRASGAGVVEMPAEVAYVEEADVTVLLDVPTERPVDQLLPGSTVLVDRPLLHAAGTPDRALAAGATAYRTHGLGWVARRPLAARAPGVARRWPGLRLGPLVDAG